MAKFTEIIQCVKKTRDYADANVFMRPFEIYRAALYNVYGGSRVADVPYIIIIIYGLRAFISSMWGSLRLAPIMIVGKFQGGRNASQGGISPGSPPSK